MGNEESSFQAIGGIVISENKQQYKINKRPKDDVSDDESKDDEKGMDRPTQKQCPKCGGDIHYFISYDGKHHAFITGTGEEGAKNNASKRGYKCGMVEFRFWKDVGPLWNNDEAQRKIQSWEQQAKYDFKSGNIKYETGLTKQWITYDKDWGKTSHVEYWEIRNNCKWDVQNLDNKLDNAEHKKELISLFQSHVQPNDETVVKFHNKITIEGGNYVKSVNKWVYEFLKPNENARGMGFQVGEVLGKYESGCCLEFAHVAVSLLRCFGLKEDVAGLTENDVYVVISENKEYDDQYHAYVKTSTGYFDPMDENGEIITEEWNEIWLYNDKKFEERDHKHIDASVHASVAAWFHGDRSKNYKGKYYVQ